MADVPTYDDLLLAGRQEILRTPTRFNPEIVDTAGSDVNVVVTTGASMTDEAAGFSQQALNELSLSTAAKVGGEVLDRFLWDRYQLVRQGAQQAVVTLTFQRTDGSAARAVGAESVVATADGQTFETINDVVFAVGQLGPLSVTATAQTTGALGNVEAGSIITIITRLDDTTITVSNLEPAAGGAEEESDEAFADRGRDFFVNARRGTRRAIQTGCLDTAGVAQATVTEDLTPDGDPLFRVQAIISDPDGQANAALASAVKTNLEEFRALGVPVRVLAGTPQYVDIIVEGVTFAAGANTTTLIDQLRASVVTAVNQLAPGKTLERALIHAALKLNNDVSIPDNAVVEPAGDLVPTGSGTIRTTSARVSINGEVGL